MKRIITLTVWLAGGWLLSPSLQAENAGLPGNPYAVVVARNIFGLNPPVVVDPNAVAVEPPVKIVPNGIMSIFGQLQVLFKVPGKPPAKDASYILMEGQSQDEIEVVKINEKAGSVTFNNHGIVQELPLVATPPTALPAATAAAYTAAAVGVPKPAPGIAPGGSTGANPFSNRFGNRGGTSGGNPGNADSGQRNVPTRSPTLLQHPQNNMTAEESTIVMEVNRELTKHEVLQGNLPPLPPTELTPPDATGVGGRPLVAPGPGAPPP